MKSKKSSLTQSSLYESILNTTMKSLTTNDEYYHVWLIHIDEAMSNISRIQESQLSGIPDEKALSRASQSPKNQWPHVVNHRNTSPD